MATKTAPSKPAKKTTAGKGAAMACGPSKSDEARWRAEEDLRTMQRMADLKSDPARVRAAEKLIEQQMKAMQALKGR